MAQRWIGRGGAPPRRMLRRRPAVSTIAVVIALVVFGASAAALAGCGGGAPAPQATAATRSSRPSAPSSAARSVNPTISGSTFVDRLPPGSVESHVIDVDLVKVIDPARETYGNAVPGRGDRVVALVFRMRCISGHELAQTEVQISTSNGHSYSPVIADIEGYDSFTEDGDFGIFAGQTLTFTVSYFLPNGVTITGVEWKPYFSEDSSGKWTVRE